MRRTTVLSSILVCLLLALAAPVYGQDADKSVSGGAKAKRSAKKSQNYEIKQNLKKERKKRRREQKEEERNKMLNNIKRKKTQEKKQKKGIQLAPEAKEAADEKISFLRRQVERSGSKIVTLNPNSYREYVNNGPRLHWSLVVYTARGARYRCSICHTVHPHVLRIAKSLNYSLEHPTFVMEVDIQRNQEIFNEIKLNHAPVFLMVPPTSSEKAPKVKTLYNKLPDKYRLNAHGNIGVEDLKKFVGRITKQDFELIEIIDYNVLLGWVILLGMVVAFIYYKGDQFHRIRDYWTPYFASCCIAYIWLMGGGMYNIIRGTSFTGSGVGFSSLFHPSNGTQYGAGGLIVGCLNFGVGVMLILMNTWALKDPKAVKNSKKSYREPRTPLQRLKEMKPSAGVCLIGATILWYNLVMIYTMKNPSYRFGFVRA